LDVGVSIGTLFPCALSSAHLKAKVESGWTYVASTEWIMVYNEIQIIPYLPKEEVSDFVHATVDHRDIFSSSVFISVQTRQFSAAKKDTFQGRACF
jgi:hypothetical protein